LASGRRTARKINLGIRDEYSINDDPDDELVV
jgi:hypothetical protein